MKDMLYKFFDAVVDGNEDLQREAIASASIHATQAFLGLPQAQPEPVTVNESHMVKMLREMFEGSPITFKGDEVMVDGKRVGVIQTDYTDFESGTQFIEDGGQFSKEFDDAEKLFQFLIQRYTKNGV